MDTLLISADFFGYPQEIVKALEARGKSVLWFEDRPASDTLTKALVRISPDLVERRSAAYFERAFQEAIRHDIRDIVVIKGEAMSLATIARMRALFPKARHTLYFWDNYRNMPRGSAAKVDLFDRAFSFDVADTDADARLTYRPLFFIERYTDVGGVTQDIDLLFIGTAHSDRVEVLDRIRRTLPPGYRFEVVLYARSRLLHGIQRLVSPPYRRIDASDFIFTPLPKAEVQRLIGRARIVVDIERSIQTGFTMRTIEMLGASRKLVTTNPSIHKADFYDDRNQFFADRADPVIDPAFIDAPWRAIDRDLLQRYSLTGWLNDIFD